MKSSPLNILAVLFLSLFLYSTGYAGTPENFSLQTLEDSARRQIEDKRPDIALDIYRQYEKEMIDKGWDALNADLLRNQAISAYQAGLFGESLAYLKQLIMIGDNEQNRQMLNEVQTLIEHNIFQKFPNHAFVRGDSDNFIEWKYSHKAPCQNIKLMVLFSFSIFCLMTSLAIILRKRGRGVKIILISLTLLALLSSIENYAFYSHWKNSDNLSFGVLLDTLDMRTEPDKTGTLLPQNTFIPGMTVQIVATVPGWVKVIRADGETGWAETGNCYLLRGVGEQRSSSTESWNLKREKEP